MTQPTHGLDPNALEALRNELEGEYGEKVIGKQTLYWLVTAYLAALSQNPGTSNTSGEAGPVAWRFKADDPHYDDTYVYCATEEMALLRCPKNSKVEPLYAALEPRASDREAVAVEALKQYQAAIASCLTAGGVPINDLGQPQSWWTEIIEAQQSGSAAIRKLSEVSHEH